MSIHWSIHLHLYFCSLSICLSVRPSICPSDCPSICLSDRPSVCLSVCPSLCLSIHLSVYIQPLDHINSAIIMISPRPETSKYKEAMKLIQPIVDDHRKNLVKGTPQLNYCDPAVMVILFTAHSVHSQLKFIVHPAELGSSRM